MAIPVRAVLWEPRMASLPMSDHEWQMYAVPAAGEHYWHDRTGYTVKEIEEVDGETRVHLIRDPAWEEEMATGLADDQSIVGGRQSETGEWHFDVVDKAGHRRGWSFGNDLELTIRDAVGNTQNP